MRWANFPHNELQINLNAGEASQIVDYEALKIILLNREVLNVPVTRFKINKLGNGISLLKNTKIYIRQEKVD